MQEILDDHQRRTPIDGMAGVYSPLVPELLRQNLLAEGIDNPNETTFVRRMSEFGTRSTDVTRDTLRIASGFTYNINYNWTWDTHTTWGRTNQELELNGGQINTDRARLALDVVEDANRNLVCADPIARMQGCAPLNLFGENTVSEAAVDYISTPAKATGTPEQFVVDVVSGDLPIELAGGFVGLAGGLEYREEKGTYSPGDTAQTGASSTNRSDPTNDRFDTKDIFFETRLPVLMDLSVDLAARHSDHSASGSATTWNRY